MIPWAERNRTLAKRAVWTVLACGVLAFVVRGATRPADPVLAGTGLTPPPLFDEVEMTVTTPEGQVLDWCALLAATDAARQRGLMGVEDLLGYDGMVFRFDQPTAAQFYMYKTLVPLSIAFFDEQGAFVSSTDMEPCSSEDPGSCPTYPAAKPFSHAIEVLKGDLPERGLVAGSSLALVEGDCR